MIAIVDYGIGNLGSVTKAFRHVGAPAALSGDPTTLESASALVLPGDGAFGAAMDELRRRELLPVLSAAVEAGKPLLAICIGMQLLFETSAEHGQHAGLGWLPGHVRRFDNELVVPHMGWNAVRQKRAHPLFAGVPEDAYVYFVHSYFCDAHPDVVLATSDYGGEFAAVVGRDNILGVQFHPEKSQGVGICMIANFARVVHERQSGRVA